jgi:hypothetical protein
MKYTVLVIRTSYGNREIEVEANSEEEAKEKAIDEAGNYEFSEHTSNYEVDYVTKKE